MIIHLEKTNLNGYITIHPYVMLWGYITIKYNVIFNRDMVYSFIFIPIHSNKRTTSNQLIGSYN